MVYKSMFFKHQEASKKSLETLASGGGCNSKQERAGKGGSVKFFGLEILGLFISLTEWLPVLVASVSCVSMVFNS